MFKPSQYRSKAGEYGDLAKTSAGLAERRSFRKLEQRFAVLADNEQWLADNYQNTVRTEQERSVGAPLADEEELVLRCLGAALIMQWNTLRAVRQCRRHGRPFEHFCSERTNRAIPAQT